MNVSIWSYISCVTWSHIESTRPFRFSALAEFSTAKPDTNREHKRGLRAQTGHRAKNTGPCRPHRRPEKGPYRGHSIGAHGFVIFHSRAYSNCYYIEPELRRFDRGSWFFDFSIRGSIRIVDIGGLQVR